MVKQYEIGGYVVDMTEEQAKIWNAGGTATEENMEGAELYDPGPPERYIPLWDAIKNNGPIWEELHGSPANQIN